LAILHFGGRKFFNPMDHSDLVKAHFDSKYYDYDILIRKLIPKYDDMHQLVVDSIDFPSDKKFDILDLGIGTGQTALALLKKFPNVEIDGVDISGKMIAQGKERLKDFLNKVNFTEQDIKDLKAKKEYSACVAVLCVHHLSGKQKQALFKKIFSSLVPNGIFVIGDIIKFDSDIETKKKEGEWKDFLIKNLGENEGNYWFENYQEEDLPSSIPEQLRWLQEAGFAEAKSLWEYMNYGVLFARKS